MMYVSRSDIFRSVESIGAKTGQRGGVQSGTIPLTAPGPCYFPLETPYTGLNT